MTKQRVRRLEEIGEESKRRILDAAEELFAEKGYGATTFIEIGDRCGISHGSIPWHFGNKLGLLMAVIERGIQRSIPSEPIAPGADGLSAHFDGLKEWLHTPTARMLSTVLFEALRPDSSYRDKYWEFHESSRARFVGWSERTNATAPRKGTAAPRDLAVVMLGAIMGIHLQYQLRPEGIDLDAALEALFEIIVRSTVSGPDTSPRRVPAEQKQSVPVKKAAVASPKARTAVKRSGSH